MLTSTQDPPELLSAKEAAELSGLPISTVRQALIDHELRAYRPGTGPKARYYIKPEDLDLWLLRVSR